MVVPRPLDDILPYARIVALRKALADGKTPPRDDYERFAGSILSPADARLLKDSVAIDRGPDVAADNMLAAFVRGGFGDFNVEIRQWLEFSGSADTSITETVPLILAGCVRQLEDGTSLRYLFEFSDNPNVRAVLRQVLEDVDDEGRKRLLCRSKEAQIASLLGAPDPSNRLLWVLRSYVSNPMVFAYLGTVARSGRVAALVSYATAGGVIDWSLVDAARLENDQDMRLTVNVALENVARGATTEDLLRLTFLKRLSNEAIRELLDGLEATSPRAT